MAMRGLAPLVAGARGAPRAVLRRRGAGAALVGARLGRARGLLSQAFAEQTVRDAINVEDMANKLSQWTVGEDETVFTATRCMVERRVGCLCVTRQGRVVGIITERDYLTKVLHAGRRSETALVKDIATMEDKLVVAQPEDSLQDCIDMMVFKNIRHLPIERDGEIVALLGVEDIAKALADEREVTMHTLDELRIAHKMPIHDG